MEAIEVTGKKIGDAIKEGLKLLGTTIDKVEYTVISAGGLFKKAKIRIAILEDESEKQEKKKQQTNKEAAKTINQENDFVKHQNGNVVQSQKNSFKNENVQKEVQQKNSAQPISKAENHAVKQKESFSNSTSSVAQKNSKQKPQHSCSHASERPLEGTPKDSKRRTRTDEIAEANVSRAVDFLSKLIGFMGFEAQIKTSIVDGDLVVDLINESGALIGYRGETLDALEYLVNIQTNTDDDKYINIVVDSCGYRSKREKMLVTMAEHAANKCIKTGRKVIMEPMNRNSRRIVHSTLSNYDNIFTKSEGNEPNRYIILYFKREKK